MLTPFVPFRSLHHKICVVAGPTLGKSYSVTYQQKVPRPPNPWGKTCARNYCDPNWVYRPLYDPPARDSSVGHSCPLATGKAYRVPPYGTLPDAFFGALCVTGLGIWELPTRRLRELHAACIITLITIIVIITTIITIIYILSRACAAA